MSAQSDQLGNTNLDPFQTIRLAPIPKPVILATTGGSSPARAFVRPSNSVLLPSEGVYQKDLCGTCLAAYRVFGANVPRNTVPQASQFVVLPRGDGTPQGDTPLGEPVSVLIDCDPLSDQDMYLALQLVGEGATPFRTNVLSRRSTRITCGATLAEPDRDRGHDSRGDRGRSRR